MLDAPAGKGCRPGARGGGDYSIGLPGRRSRSSRFRSRSHHRAGQHSACRPTISSRCFKAPHDTRSRSRLPGRAAQHSRPSTRSGAPDSGHLLHNAMGTRAAACGAAAAAAALALLLLAAPARACTDVLLKDNCTSNAVVSGRTMSFPISLTPVMLWAAKGTTLTRLEVAPGVPSTLTGPTKHSFVCISHARYEIEKLLPANQSAANKALAGPDFVWCIDGMNDAGLVAAVLYQSETHAIAAYDKASPKKQALNFLNLGEYALANFDSVKELKQHLQKDLQVTWSSAYNKFGRALSGGASDVPSLHVTFHDAHGASIVVQFRGKHGVMEVLDNPLGVFANDPLLQENLQHYKEYRAAMFANPADRPPSVKQAPTHESAAFTGGKADAKLFWPVPGDYSGPSRFTRLALVKEAAEHQCWRNRSLLFPQLYETLNPGFVPRGWPASNPTLMTVLGIMNTVYLPNGISDAGIRGPSSMPEFTAYATLRDHGARVFYYRTANNPTFKRLDLRAIDWADVSAKHGGVAHSYLVYAQQPWWQDASDEFKSGRWGDGSLELITAGPEAAGAKPAPAGKPGAKPAGKPGAKPAGKPGAPASVKAKP